MHDDLPVGLLELAARVDEGKPIDWDAEERAAADDEARAVIEGFRVLASVAAVAQDDSFAIGWDARSPGPAKTKISAARLGSAAPRESGRPRRLLAGLSGRRSARPARRREAAGAAPRRRRPVGAGPRRGPRARQRQASEHRRRARRGRARWPRRPVDGVRARAARWPPRSTRAAPHSADEAIVDRPGAVRRARRRPRQGAHARRRQGAQRDARGGRPRRPHGLRRRPDRWRRPYPAPTTSPGRRCISCPERLGGGAADRGDRHLQPRRAPLSPGDAGVPGRRHDAGRNRGGASHRTAHAAPRSPSRFARRVRRRRRARARSRSRGALRRPQARSRKRSPRRRGRQRPRPPESTRRRPVVRGWRVRGRCGSAWLRSRRWRSAQRPC